jgi:hypothetical protein
MARLIDHGSKMMKKSSTEVTHFLFERTNQQNKPFQQEFCYINPSWHPWPIEKSTLRLTRLTRHSAVTYAILFHPLPSNPHVTSSEIDFQKGLQFKRKSDFQRGSIRRGARSSLQSDPDYKCFIQSFKDILFH